jgi:hypothetical protein
MRSVSPEEDAWHQLSENVRELWDLIRPYRAGSHVVRFATGRPFDAEPLVTLIKGPRAKGAAVPEEAWERYLEDMQSVSQWSGGAADIGTLEEPHGWVVIKGRRREEYREPSPGQAIKVWPAISLDMSRLANPNPYCGLHARPVIARDQGFGIDKEVRLAVVGSPDSSLALATTQEVLALDAVVRSVKDIAAAHTVA